MTAFLGNGWTFPIRPNAAGYLSYTDGDANVAQSLRLLLATSMGERVMRPRFGTEAERMVFAPGSKRNHGLIERAIRDAVRDHEPRVILDDVLVITNPEEPERVDIEVTYTVRRTATRTSVVFPYYLSRIGPLP